MDNYLVRTYGTKDSVPTKFDTQLYNALEKFESENKDEIEKRKCSFYLDIVPLKNETIETKETVYCTATKNNGEKCTAKAKSNELFCGRHIKK